MKIISTEPLKTYGKACKKSNRYLIHITVNDEDFSFALYSGEMRRYKLIPDNELPDSVFLQLVDEVLFPRAKNRCEYLLARKSYTTYEIREKLRTGSYPLIVIDKTVGFLQDYGFINDEYYAKRYLETYMNKKSLRCIRMKLLEKGIKRELIDEVFSFYLPSDEDALKRLCDKRVKDSELSDPKIYNRHMRYLISKGFSYDDVKAELAKRK